MGIKIVVSQSMPPAIAVSKALKKLKKKLDESGRMKEFRKHQYFLTRNQRRRLARHAAARKKIK